jgi:uncharacterized protein (UPF0276 family)
MSEWQFISEIAERADIGLLFDVNNVYVSARNHGFDAREFVRSVPHERILQIHLAGHTDLGKYIIDTHRGHVVDAVWELYRDTIRLTGPVSTLIEWDDAIPEWSVLAAEAERARRIRSEVLGELAPSPSREVPRTAQGALGGAFAHGGPRELAGRESSALGVALAE